MRKEIVISEINDFKSIVESMDVNVKYVLPNKYLYEYIVIEKSKDLFTKEDYYSWIMHYNYKVSGRVGYVYPYASSGNKIRTFKTEKGAKKHLIREYQEFFNK